jgi:hypothetical protein
MLAKAPASTPLTAPEAFELKVGPARKAKRKKN